MNHNLSELKELIAAKLDVAEILDILGWTIPELLDAIEEAIEDNQESFEDAVS